jgi:hypothetical protein
MLSILVIKNFFEMIIFKKIVVILKIIHAIKSKIIVTYVVNDGIEKIIMFILII